MLIFLLQIIVILLVVRALSMIFGFLKQPIVVIEMIAGICLGPSLLGKFLPNLQAQLFPIESLSILKILSEMGLIFFLFTTGLEFDWKSIKNKGNVALTVSFISISFSFLIGLLLAHFLLSLNSYSYMNNFSFYLFIGISLSITAFPVLARILKEKNLTNTKIGQLCIASAAIDDVTAWFLLAIILAISNSAGIGDVIYLLIYILIFIFFVSSILTKIISSTYVQKKLNILTEERRFSLLIIAILISAVCTEKIGIHSLFGGFLAGVFIPITPERKELIKNKINPFLSAFFIPLFFVITGLRTKIFILNNTTIILIFLIVLFLSFLGKFGGSYFASKFMRLSNRDSLAIGCLMNTRGLMELIVLNIGYEKKIINQELFTIFVLMALVTTFMTGPIFHFIEKKHKFV